MLDRLSPQIQHLALMLLAAALTWAGTDVVPWLSAHDGWGPIVGTLAGGLVAWTLLRAGRAAAIRSAQDGPRGDWCAQGSSVT